MAEQNFAVNYKINVVDNGSKSIQKFTDALATLPNKDPFSGIKASLVTFQDQVASVTASLNQIGNAKVKKIGISFTPESWRNIEQAKKKIATISSDRSISISINAQNAHRSIDKLETRLKKLCGKGYIIPVSVGTPPTSSGNSTTRSAVGTMRNTRVRATTPTTFRSVMGPTYFNSGPNVAQEMVKGMGMMYGLQAVISGISGAVKDAISYQNISQTTKNILQANDTRGSFNERFNAMNMTLRNIGVQTKFTAPEVASAGKFLAMAGQGVEEIQGSMRAIANLALIGDTDLGQTADVTTNIMAGFNIKASQMDRVADVLTKTFTSSNTTLMELAESFKYVGSISRQAGLKFEDVAAAMGVLGNAGVKGSSAGTALRNIIYNVLAPTKKQAEAWKSTGIKTTDEYGNMRSLSDLFADLGRYTQDMTSESKVKLFSALFFKRASTSAASLGINAANIDKIFKASSSTSSMGIAHDLAWAKNNMTVEGLWHQTTSAFTEAGIKAFESIQSPLMGFLRELTEKFKRPEFVEQMKSGMQFMLDIVKAIVDAIGTIGKMWANTPDYFKSIFKTFVTVQMWMGIVLSPIKALASMLSPLGALVKRTQAIASGEIIANGGANTTGGRLSRGVMYTRGRMNQTYTRWRYRGLSNLAGMYFANHPIQASPLSNAGRKAITRYAAHAPGMFTFDRKLGRFVPTQMDLFRYTGPNDDYYRSRIDSRQAALVRYQRMRQRSFIHNPLGVMQQSSVRSIRMTGAALSGIGKAAGIAKAGITSVLGALGIAPWMAAVAAVGAFAYGVYQANAAADKASESFSRMNMAAKSLTETNIDWSDSNALILSQMGTVSSWLSTESDKVLAAADVWNKFWRERSGVDAPKPDALFKDQNSAYNDVINTTTGFNGWWNRDGKNWRLANAVAAQYGLINLNEKDSSKRYYMRKLNKNTGDKDALQALSVYAYAMSGDNPKVKQYKRGLIEDINALDLRDKKYAGDNLYNHYQNSRLHGESDVYGEDMSVEAMQKTRAFSMGTNRALTGLYKNISLSYLRMADQVGAYRGHGRAYDNKNQAATDFIASMMGWTGYTTDGKNTVSNLGKAWGSNSWATTIRRAAGYYQKEDGTWGWRSHEQINRNIVQMYQEFMRMYDQITDQELKAMLKPYTYTGVWDTYRMKGSKHLDFGVNSLPGGGTGGTQTWKSPSQEDAKIKGYGATPKQIIVNIENLMKIDKIDATDERKMAAISNLKQELAQALVSVVSDVDDEWGRGSTGL